MKYTQKGFILPLILIAAAIIAAGTTVYVVKKREAIKAVQMPEQKGLASNTNVAATGSVNTEAVNTSQPAVASTIPPATATAGTSVSVTAKNVMALAAGDPLYCTNAANANATVYINNGMVRTDLVTRLNEKNEVASILIKDGMIYSWRGTLGQAFPIKGQSLGSLIAQNTGQSMQCHPWTADPSKFAIPSSVQFRKMDSITIPTNITMPTIPTTPEELEKQQNIIMPTMFAQ
ncbi:MAG: hypothetical protein V4478_00370 [Patescibacteria group bacterium]